MDKYQVSSFNVFNRKIDICNPLSVGNGNLCVTVDITGTQSLYEEYNFIPLLSMSNLCWVTNKNNVTINKQLFNAYNHIVGYDTSNINQEAKFNELRCYPYKFNFFTYQLFLNNELINKENISDIKQELDLYNGIIISEFKYLGENVVTKICVDAINDVFKFEIFSNLNFTIKLFFPKSSWKKEGSLFPLLDNYQHIDNHIFRHTENEVFECYLNSNKIIYNSDHIIIDDTFFEITIGKVNSYQNNLNSYFDKVNIRLFNSDIDNISKAEEKELNRRLVLSLYLLKINSLGTYPPQETGLTFNSWNSKFHLEMHPWHSLWTIDFNLETELLKQLDYYLSILPEAKIRAINQGYEGARLPKMTSFLGEDSPSNIGCLLLWQQPHLIMMIDKLYKKTNDISILKKYYDLLVELTIFLESFLYKENGKYNLDYPIIPAQECYDPNLTRNPIFEIEYVRFAFQKMVDISKVLNKSYPASWQDIIDNMIEPKIHNGVYLATTDLQGDYTYTKYAYDHPLVIMPYSFILSDRIDKKIMRNSLNKVLEIFDLAELWGWDFPLLAMCAYYLDDKELAIKLLLLETPKNEYLKNGHNKQANRADLPIYLPGNGAYLLCVSKILKV